MWDDPIVAEVRQTRERLARRFNYDLRAIFADLRARQGALGSRLVRGRGEVGTPRASASVEPSTKGKEEN